MRFIILLTIIFFSTCSYEQPDITGLWKLVKVEKDGFIKEAGTTYVEIRPNSSFAVSRTSGDIVGVYKLNANKLELHSRDNTWFNTYWEVNHDHDILKWRGLEFGFGNVFLEFHKVDEIPQFSDFRNAVTGKWQLYKTRTKKGVRHVSETWFIIGEDDKYQIVAKDEILEEGRAIINPRHQKIIFENDQISWNAWFYGKELRLENQKLRLQYSLRKIPDE